tara:strand:+ start:123 stop:443 length:321 start_codon:yes stop_codon:yes gene_type:complete
MMFMSHWTIFFFGKGALRRQDTFYNKRTWCVGIPSCARAVRGQLQSAGQRTHSSLKKKLPSHFGDAILHFLEKQIPYIVLFTAGFATISPALVQTVLIRFDYATRA